MLVIIILIGKFIDSYAKSKTIDQLSNLASHKISRANLIKSINVKEITLLSPSVEVPVELLENGDFVIVKPGEGIPTDGVIVFGRGSCNEILLTG